MIAFPHRLDQSVKMWEARVKLMTMNDTNVKMKVTSVTQHDPSMPIGGFVSPFGVGSDRIYVSALRQDLPPPSIPEGVWASMSPPEPMPFDVKIKTDNQGEEKDARLTISRGEARRMQAQMMEQRMNRNPTVIPLTTEEYESLGRPTVGDVIELTVHRPRT